MKLSVLMPVYNEEAGLETILRRVAAVDIEKEIIVVDDCSSDGTAGILERIDIPGLKVIRHSVNRGKGAAIRTALQAVTGDAVIIQDADLEYDPQDYPALLQPIIEGKAQVVYGVRDLSVQALLVRLGNKFLTAKIIRQGYKIHEVPISYHPRKEKKLSPWRDGLPALRALLKYRWWRPKKKG